MTLNTVYQVFILGTLGGSNAIAVPAVRDGEITDVTSSQLNEALNSQETFTFTLKSKDAWNPKIVLDQTQVQVTRNGVVIWWGIITNIDGKGGLITWTAQDFSFLLTKRYIAPVVKTPYYSTRFQLQNTAINVSHVAPQTFGSNRQSAFVADTFATNGLGLAVKNSGVSGTDILWKLSINGENSDLYYNTNSTSRWDAQAFVGYSNTQYGNVPGTVQTDPASNPDIYVVNTAHYTLVNDSQNIPITPFPGAGSYATYINWFGYIDSAHTLNANTALGGKFWRRWQISNNTVFPKEIHAVAYVRLNDTDFLEDPFSSLVPTMADPATFSIFNSDTWNVQPGQPAIAKFGIVDTTYTGAEVSSNLGFLNWIDVASINTASLPANQWVRLVMTTTLPALSTDNNVVFQWQGATPHGYIIGGLDILIDDGLFYSNVEQGQILQDIWNYVQNASYGWATLASAQNIAVGANTTSSPRTKQYLFSDYQTAYDAMWEYTTLYQGFDFAWTYANMNRQFNAYFSPGTPGANVGSSVGKGVVQPTILTHGQEIIDYEVLGDGTQMADIVGVFEPTTNTIDGMARDFVTAQNIPSGRWQLAEVYEGTPGGTTLTLQSQAQRGLNRYGMPAWSLNLTLDPGQTTFIFTHQIGDVVSIILPELGLNGVQFRITGRQTNLASDTVVLTVQQYFGV